MLKFSLRGKGLTEEQLDFAALRLGQLQDAIRKGEEHYKDRDLDADLKQKKEKNECQAYDEGFLRTVPDEDFAKLKIRNLCPTEPVNKLGWQKNLFGELRYWIPGLIRGARKKGVSFVPTDQREEKAPELTEVDTAGKSLNEKLSVRNIQDSITGISNLVSIRDREKFGGRQHVDELTEGKRTSKQFTALVKEVKALEAMQKYFHKINASGLPLTGQEYRQYYEKVQASLDSIEEKKRLYMANKMRQRKVTEEKDLRGKNDYEQRRIDYVKNVGKYVNKAKFRFGKLTPPDELLKDQDEVRAQAEQRDLEERRAAKEALEKLHREKGLASPEQVKNALNELYEQAGKDLAAKKKALENRSPEAAEIAGKYLSEQQKAAEELKKQQEPQGPVL